MNNMCKAEDWRGMKCVRCSLMVLKYVISERAVYKNCES